MNYQNRGRITSQHRSAMSCQRSGGHGHIKFCNADTKNERAVSQSFPPFKMSKSDSSAPRRNKKKRQSNKNKNAASREDKEADSGKKLDVDEMDVDAALDEVVVMPIDDRSPNKAAKKGGKVAVQQPNINRRLIAVEEEDAEESHDQVVYLNHQDSERVLNENIEINHPLIDVAAGQQKDSSRCMESNKKERYKDEEMDVVGSKRK